MSKVYAVEFKNMEGNMVIPFTSEYLLTTRGDAERLGEIYHTLGYIDKVRTPIKIVVYKNGRIGKKEHQAKMTKKVKLIQNFDHDILHSKMFTSREMEILLNEGFIVNRKKNDYLEIAQVL